MRVLRTKTKCTNGRAKECGYYIGKVSHQPDDSFKIRFAARLNWADESTEISYLDTNRGECHKLETQEDSQGCGIGRELMILCLGHEDITEDGGLDPSAYNEEGIWGQTLWRDINFSSVARELCKTIVAIICAPTDQTTNYACKAYIEAAKIKKYQMMFVEKDPEDVGPDDHYHVLKTKDAELEFNKNPDAFIQSKGNEWFFCKCKRGSTKECFELDKYAEWNGRL